MLIELLERLINKKYYADRQAIENKLNVFYAMNKITDEEYSNLILKVNEVYEVATEEINTETEPENTVEETIVEPKKKETTEVVEGEE